jgi:hypothetical protein
MILIDAKMPFKQALSLGLWANKRGEEVEIDCAHSDLLYKLCKAGLTKIGTRMRLEDGPPPTACFFYRKGEVEKVDGRCSGLCSNAGCPLLQPRDGELSGIP